MKKKVLITVGILSTFLLAGCSNQNTSSGNHDSKKSSVVSTKKSSNQSSQSKKSAEEMDNAQSSSSSSANKSQSSSSIKQTNNKSEKETKNTVKSNNSDNKMNFDQIEQGNYSSLAGTWKSTKIVVRDGGEDKVNTENPITLAVTPDTIQMIGGDKVVVNKDGLSYNDDLHPLTFQKTQNSLTGALDGDAPINWSVSFYPAGSTDFTINGEKQAPSSKNLIVFWRSGMSTTMIFEKE